MGGIVDSFFSLGAPKENSSLAGRVRAAQTAAVRRYTPWMMVANIANALLIAWAFRDSPYLPHVVTWSLIVVIVAAFAAVRWWRGKRRRAKPTASVRSVRRMIVHAFVLGAVWAILPAFFAVADMEQRVIIGSVVAGMLCGSGFALATVAPAAIAFSGTLAIGSSVAALASPGFTTIVLLLLNVVYIAVVSTSTLALSRMLRERIEAQIASEEQRDFVGLLLNDFEENGSEWVWMTDSHGRLRHVSTRLIEMLGCAEADVVGRPALFCLPLALRDMRTSEERARIKALARKMGQQEAFQEVEIIVRSSSGPQLWALTGKPVIGADGRFEGYRGIGRNVTEIQEARQRIEHLARFDALTGLANRATLIEHIDHMFARLKRKGGVGVLMLIDLDHFKTINDAQGHPTGDRLLMHVAERLKSLIDDDQLVARLGGDEFALVFYGAPDAETIGRFATRVAEIIAAPFELVDGVSTRTSASIGVATGSAGSDTDTLIRHADLALYRAKNEGRARVAFFEPALEAAAQRRHRLERDLRMALRDGGLHLAYQPLVDADTLRIVGCEALLRWSHSDFGTIGPSEFVAIAEESGLIDQLGDFVLKTACRTASDWPEEVCVAVNLSPVQFRSPNLFVSVRAALAESGLSPNRLELEITESLFLEPGDHVDATLDALRRLGVRIALDDFGIGYSSLSYLLRYEFDKLKIDRSFVCGLENGRQSAAIIAAIVSMAEQLGIRPVVEGVETETQVRALRAMGCRIIQGYVFGKPVSAQEIKERFTEQGKRCSDSTCCLSGGNAHPQPP